MTEPRGIDLLRRAFGRMEMGAWCLAPWQFELALVSPPFKELMRLSHEDPDPSSPVPLSRLWDAAGRPAELEPRAWIAALLDEHAKCGSEAIDRRIVEDRGEAGVLASWEAAAWYVQALDPDRVTIENVRDLAY